MWGLVKALCFVLVLPCSSGPIRAPRDAVCPLSQQRWSGRSSQPSPILREIPGAHPAAIPVLGTRWWAGDAGRAWHISLASPLLLWAAAGAATKAKLRGRHHRAALSRAHTSAESRQEPEEQVAHDLLPRLPPAPPALC